MRTFGAGARRFALTTLVCAALFVAAGAVFSAVTGHGTRVSIASALFIGAAVVIMVNTLGETGLRDGGVDVRTGVTYPGAGSSPRGSLSWVLVGVALVGLGVLVLIT
jgi:hypothetical protein